MSNFVEIVKSHVAPLPLLNFNGEREVRVSDSENEREKETPRVTVHTDYSTSLSNELAKVSECES